MQETNISKKTLREFGILIGFGFPILIGWLIPLLTGHSFRGWSLLIGFLGLILGVTAPKSLLHPYRLWMKLGHILGWLNSHVILGLVFIFIVQPIALIMKSFGYDPLKIKKRNTNTYKEKITHKKIDLNRIF